MNDEKLKDKWFSPENLQLQEAATEKEFSSTGNIAEDSDFKAYILLQKSGDNSFLQSHNAVGERCSLAADFLSALLSKLFAHPSRIMDLGCGAGFIAHQISLRIPAAQIKGIDASRNAILYAQQSFPKLKWEARGVDSTFKDDDQPYDAIYAWEFYPFSRTSDWSYQEGILQALANNLNQNGYLIIANVSKENTIFSNLPALKTELKYFSRVEKITIPPLRLKKIFKIDKICILIAKALRRPMIEVLVLRKQDI